MYVMAKIKNREVINHYDRLIDDNNDPVLDEPSLKEYMNKWDGQTFIDLLDLSCEKSVLEIGCGTGRLAVRVAPKVGRFLGIDISKKTVERAREHLKNCNAEIVKGDILYFETQEKFNLIYSSLTFMHIEEKQELIKKIKSLLTAGGKVVVSLDKNQSEFLDFGSYKLKVYPDTPENITKLLKEENFKNVTVYEVDFAYIVKANYE